MSKDRLKKKERGGGGGERERESERERERERGCVGVGKAVCKGSLTELSCLQDYNLKHVILCVQ